MGYTGGRTANPTYYTIGDHAEAVDVRFDPQVITHDTLLERFWASHEPTESARSTQYRAALFCHSAEEYEAAQASAARWAERHGAPVATEIFQGLPYYPAEGYHQKWRLRRNKAVFEDLQACFPTEAALLASAAAAKLNGFVGGQGDPAVLDRIIDKLGLSDEGLRALRRG